MQEFSCKHRKILLRFSVTSVLVPEARIRLVDVSILSRFDTRARFALTRKLASEEIFRAKDQF
jgi:hypothetical protein